MSFDRWRSLVDGAEIDVGSAIPDSVEYQWTTPIDGLSDNDLVETWPATVSDTDIDGEGVFYVENLNGSDAVAGDGEDDYAVLGTLGDFGSNIMDSDFTKAFMLPEISEGDDGFFYGVFDGQENQDLRFGMNPFGRSNQSEQAFSFDIEDSSGNELRGATQQEIADGNEHSVIISFGENWKEEGGDFEVYIDGSVAEFEIDRDNRPLENFSDFSQPFYSHAFNNDNEDQRHAECGFETIEIASEEYDQDDVDAFIERQESA